MTVTIQHHGPIELGSLSASLMALAMQHQRFAEQSGAVINGDQVRLYVREIRSGSIIVDLIALAQTSGSTLGVVNTVFAFAKNLGALFGYGTGKSPAPPAGTTPRDARDVVRLIEPVATDPQASMSIVARDSATVNVTNVYISSTEANATQNRLNNWIAQQAVPVNGIHRQQLFYFQRATGDASGNTGDLGVIERFGFRAVKTVFASAAVKAALLNEALFKRLYIVDVDVQTVDGQARLYRIIEVHDSMERDT